MPTSRTAQITAVVILALASLCVAVGCDPCQAAMALHTERCNRGDVASCEWRAEHIDELGNVLACGG